MRPGTGSPTTATATDGGSASAPASGPGCPRLIDGAVRRKDSILKVDQMACTPSRGAQVRSESA